MDKKMKFKNYKEFNKFWDDEFKKLNIFYAFTREQFLEGIKKLGIKESEIKKKLISVNSGGYILKSEKELYLKYFDDKKTSLNNAKKDDDFLKSCIRYQMANLEYCITGNDEEILASCGLEKARLTDREAKLYNEAKKEYIKNCNY